MESQDRTRVDARSARGGEEGMALVIALLVLLALTVLGAALMANVSTETKISGHKVRDTQALTLAEAGVQEAMLRIRNGDIPDDGNPRAVALIYNQAAGSLPVSGVDTTSLASLQPAGARLAYTTPNKMQSVLAIKYKTKNGVILKYDDATVPRVNTATGNPIWIVTATGRTGTASRQVYAEVTRTKFNVLARSAVTANVAIQFKGNIKICGHDHRYDTPTMTGPPACDGGIGNWWAPTAHTSCLPGAWSTNAVSQQGSATVQGEPDHFRDYRTGFYSGPWDALGMQQTEFWPWVGTRHASEPASTQGIYYLDDDDTKQNKSGDFAFNGGDGEGFLYCDGDLRLNGSFTYKGLIYCEGDLTINGNCWILGGIVVNGKTVVKIANGSAIVLYSSEAIQQKISKFGGNLRTIAWREL
ncbi:MAG: PilX N-terminal domain-containing pilus assembly protein [Candidatus Eiseniibacteriota bacterium]